MPQPEPLSQSDQDLLGQIIGFAERRTQDGVYFNLMVSRSRGNLPVAVLVAMGDQAFAVQKLIMGAAQPEPGAIIVPENNNGGF